VVAKRSELERHMNLLLGNCPDIILLFHQDGRLAYCTESFLKLSGIPGIGIVRDKRWHELLAPYTPPEFIARLHKIYSIIVDQPQAVSFSCSLDFTRSESVKSYNVQVTPMLGENSVVEGSMIIFSDTSEIVRAQREAERANAAKSDFLATVSHEIRTPMNAIIGVADMLKSTHLDDGQRQLLDNIQRSSHTLLSLINDVLDLSKIEAGKLDLLPGYFRTHHLLRHLQDMFELMFEQKGLYFRCQYAEDLPAVVYGDDNRIRQILTNILNNALKYTHEGGVAFRVYRDGGLLCMSVKDTGIGIREDALSKLFTAFERLDLVRNKGVVGTGLGLAITKRLCDLMHGEINVQSVYGEGSCFTVLLPLQEGSEEDLPAEREKGISFKAPGAKALIVDDVEINLQVASFALGHYEIQSDLAQSGQQAIEMVLENKYDIIFMDHMMPEMDGIETTRRIRAFGGCVEHTPIVALTANAISSAVEQFYLSGFNDFLSKPMDPVALAGCLLRWLPAERIQS
jgi:signal transduction histidine kinase/ActR/RegA family two-component response regulator